MNKVLKYKRTLSLAEAIQFQFKAICPQLTDRLAMVLVYFYLYPDDYVSKMKSDDISVSKNSISAQLTYLKNMGLLIEENKMKKLNPEIKKVIVQENFLCQYEVLIK